MMSYMLLSAEKPVRHYITKKPLLILDSSVVFTMIHENKVTAEQKKASHVNMRGWVVFRRPSVEHWLVENSSRFVYAIWSSKLPRDFLLVSFVSMICNID